MGGEILGGVNSGMCVSKKGKKGRRGRKEEERESEWIIMSKTRKSIISMYDQRLNFITYYTL